MDDLIRRQAAIETVRKAKNLYQAHRMVVQLPAAQPTDRNGQARTAGRKWTEVMQMPGLIERQTIVAWYTPEEKMPPEDIYVVVTYSGHYKNITYEHALGIATWADDGCGWLLDGAPEGIEFEVHAWADLEPYKGGVCKWLKKS